VLYIPSHWSMDGFLRKATERLDLNCSATRCFNADGVEVTDMMMVLDGDMLFLSVGEEFISPMFNGEDSFEDSDRGDIPKSVGGYKVTTFLGRGGFGEVRVGEHHISGERVALKFIRKAEIADISAVERTNTEVQCLMALKHPHIITLLQHCISPTYVVLAFELMQGGDLYDHLASLPVSALSEEEARSIFTQVLGAVGHAHNNHICHRDLKLENILIVDKEPPDGSLQVKIADFGLSDFYRPGAHVRTNCGSLSYLAPEVFRGTSNAGPPLDVWAMGVILFALVCGRLPFEGSDLRNNGCPPKESVIRKRVTQCQYKIDETLTPEARDLIRRMLKLDPSERATVPEIFGHCWLRLRGFSTIDMPPARSEYSLRRRTVSSSSSLEGERTESKGGDSNNLPNVANRQRQSSDELEGGGESAGDMSSNRTPNRKLNLAIAEEGPLFPPMLNKTQGAADFPKLTAKPGGTRQNRGIAPPLTTGSLPQGAGDGRRRPLKEANFMKSTASSGFRQAKSLSPSLKKSPLPAEVCFSIDDEDGGRLLRTASHRQRPKLERFATESKSQCLDEGSDEG